MKRPKNRAGKEAHHCYYNFVSNFKLFQTHAHSPAPLLYTPQYSDLASHPAIALLPYQVSTMGLFEYYRMNIPIFAPSPGLLAEWQVKYKIMSELTWDLVFDKTKRGKGASKIPMASNAEYLHDPNNMHSKEAIEYWIKWSDFYEWPHITTYDR